MVTTRQFLNALAKAQREAERQRKAQIRAQQQSQKAYDRARQAYIKAQEQAQKLSEKEQARLYQESRVAEVEMMNDASNQSISELEGLLRSTLEIDDYLDIDKLKKTYTPPAFKPSIPYPELEKYYVAPPSGLQAFMPRAKSTYEKQFAEAKQRYERHVAEYEKQRAAHSQRVKTEQQEINDYNNSIEQFKQGFLSGDPDSLSKYFVLVLESSLYPEGFPQSAKLAYVPDSKQLVVEYDLPNIEVIPPASAYKYNKSKDEITSTARPTTQIRAIYSSVIAQVTLRTIHELFESDRTQYIDIIVFNGYVNTIDKATGNDLRICLVTVRVTRDVFSFFNLSRVDPAECLKVLKAEISRSPSELLPVRPVLELNMVDSRFIQEADILSELDQRPNLMELSPQEFESLITNLFTKMGLETKLTQSSRDGGVDCVAFDNRPIFGGKVVIQAKRYKNTVGVSAVRDLYGTVMNEGASKGIIVATSGFGKAAFDFANGKPLELIGGSQLLYLLEQHASVKAKIEVLDTWKDPIVGE